MIIKNWKYVDSAETIIEVSLEDSCGNLFTGLVQIKERYKE
jgi:hypothetical protein